MPWVLNEEHPALIIRIKVMDVLPLLQHVLHQVRIVLRVEFGFK